MIFGFRPGQVLIYIFYMTWQTIVHHLIIFRGIDGQLTPLDVRQVAVINLSFDLSLLFLEFFVEIFLSYYHTRTLFQSLIEWEWKLHQNALASDTYIKGQCLEIFDFRLFHESA